ncbi:hypothetical protein AVEN_48327-1 [Araneus ventricosus]|uniref:HTH psq-type domain-containing protein n=1 Tax=Araneus ventricosus TaxID=182803 RepID=A0A4Y2M2C3_ARAVE|nr:hypothetical protein AVEN_48327-1 [Araneus ventricosus]
MSGAKQKRSVLNVKQKLEILQKLDNGESAGTDAEDVLNEGNTVSHSAALQSVETLLDYMWQRGFDYGDVTVSHSTMATSQRYRETDLGYYISNGTNDSAQRLTADQLAKRTSLQRDSSNSEDVQRRLSHLSNSQVFIPFRTGCVVA